MKYSIINCSLNQENYGLLIADYITQKNKNFNTLNLSEYSLPICNGFEKSAYTDENLKYIHDELYESNGILIISPIYHWDVCPACKNLIDLLCKPYKKSLTGQVFQHKPVAFIGTCFSHNSYLAPLNFLANLMVINQAFIAPKHTLISLEEFDKNNINIRGKKCINKVVQYLTSMAKYLKDFNLKQ